MKLKKLEKKLEVVNEVVADCLKRGTEIVLTREAKCELGPIYDELTKAEKLRAHLTQKYIAELNKLCVNKKNTKPKGE